jgi:hypothetical protein
MDKSATMPKSVAALGLLGLLLLTPGCAHQVGQANAAQTEKELLALQDEWAAARIKGDVEFLERSRFA